MASPSVVDRIRGLLASDAHERQIAAAIVLGEIGAREAPVLDALATAAAEGVPPVQRHALEALARLSSGKAARRLLPRVLPALASRDESVRRAAVQAAVAFGDEAVAPVRARLDASTDATERRALEEVLGKVGGKDALAALLGALDTTDVEAARSAALAVRQRMKEASPREKSAALAQLGKRLAEKGKRAPSPALAAGALKILGFLEDGAAVPILLAYARDARQPAPVRQEAIVALRFTARGKAGARVPAALVELADRAPPELARDALFTLASLELGPAMVPKLGKLALGREPERGLLAVERLAQIGGAAAGDALAAVLTGADDRARAEAAANALAARPDGPLALGRAFLAARDPERAALLARLLRPRAHALAEAGAAGKKLVRALVADAIARIGTGAEGDVLLPLARELDREAASSALRALARRLQTHKDAERSLGVRRLIGRSADATAEDGYALPAAELRAGHRDEALTIAGQLLDRGFDLPAALRRDRALDPELRYQIGFALAERRHPAAEEVLADLASAGRGKIAAMAKAKLKSAGYR